MHTVRVQSEPFDVSAEMTALAGGRTEIGGIGCFVGTVRATAGARTITAMSLEHYPGMTERAMAKIAGTAAERWPLLGCTLIHRVGRLLPGDGIVLVLAASAHRTAALDATAFLIDWLKTSAPFWKKEHFADGTDEWVAAKQQDLAKTTLWADGHATTYLRP